MLTALATARAKALFLAIVFLICDALLMRSLDLDTRLWLTDDVEEQQADDSGEEVLLYDQPARLVAASANRSTPQTAVSSCIMMLALMPWTVVAMRALVDAAIESVNEWRARLTKNRYVSHARWGDAFPEFLVLWTLFPIVFFSFSGSKLPGYLLPSIPPLTILTADYLNRIRREGLPKWLLWSHAALCALMVFVLVLAPQHMKYETLVPSVQWLIIAAAATFAPTAPIRNFQCAAFNSDAAKAIGKTAIPGCSALRVSTFAAGVRIATSSRPRGSAPNRSRSAATSVGLVFGSTIEVNSGL